MISVGLLELIPNWILISLGLVLLAVEMFSALFILLWFGIGLITVGLLGFAVDFTYGEYQLIIATAIGVFLLLGFRRRILPAQNDANNKTLSTYEAGGQGKLAKVDDEWLVFYNGTFWTVANPREDLVEDQLVRIVEVKNNRVTIES